MESFLVPIYSFIIEAEPYNHTILRFPNNTRQFLSLQVHYSCIKSTYKYESVYPYTIYDFCNLISVFNLALA